MFHSLFPFPDYIHIENFKAIGDAQRVPVRPLTLLFGQNSAGKSSVLHAIALMAHFSQVGMGRDVRTVELNGTDVRVGDFNTYRHRRKKPAPVMLGWQCNPSDLEPRGVTQKVYFSTVGFDSRLIASGFTVSEDGNPLISAKWSSDHIKVGDGKRVRPCYLAIDNISRALTDSQVSACISKLSGKVVAAKELKQVREVILKTLRSASLKKDVHAAVTHYFARLPLNECRLQLEEMLPRSTWHSFDADEQAMEQLRDAGNATNPQKRIADIVLQWVTAYVRSATTDYINDLPYAELRSVVYFGKHRREIGPDDVFTKDSRRTSANLTSVQYSKGWTFNDVAISNLNDWLRMSGRSDLGYELRLVELEALDGAIATESKYLLRLYDRRQKKLVSFDEVGAGIGQLLPVLLAANGEIGSTILVEQPELHLHPALQAEIGDAFIYSALGSEEGEPLLNRFILETHSEHILLRLMRRMRQTATGQLPKGLPPVTPNDVAVLYIEKSASGSGSIVRELRLNEMGELIDDWPGGFFEEGLREVLM